VTPAEDCLRREAADHPEPPKRMLGVPWGDLMSKKMVGVLALATMCVLSVFLLNCGSSSSRPAGVVYALTQGNNGIGNNVSSFAMDLNSGNLSLINSNASTCASGSTCGLPVDIVLDPTGATAFVLGQGAITSFNVNSDGSLGSPINAWTVPSGTALSMTRDSGGNFLFVTTDTPELYALKITPGSTSVSTGGTLVLTKFPTGTSSISFAAPSNTTPPCGFSTTEEFVFVTSNHDFTDNHYDNALSVYCVDSSGDLTDMTPQTPYIPQIDPLSVFAVNTNPATQPTSGGIFVYVGSQPTASGALSVFQMCTQVGVAGCTQQNVTSAQLVPVTGTVPATGQDPVQMVTEPTNSFLYVVCSGSNQVFAYSITAGTGVLKALNPPNLPTGTQPVSAAMHPSVNNSGQFLYTSNGGSNSISGFTLDTISGAMIALNPVITPAAPTGIAVH
jgi:hypothetical protein